MGKAIESVNRLSTILGAVVGLGLAAVVERSPFNRNESRATPKRIRKTLEHLGPTFMKVGQILSLRSDFIPMEYCDELKKLLDAAPVFAFEEAKLIVKEELGKPVEEIFRSLDPTPVAAASLAQVHVGVLRNGHKVAVKIQRPHIRETVMKDLSILRHVAFFFEEHFQASRIYRPVETVKEIYDAMALELDFRVEGRNAQRFRENFKNSRTVKVPRIYWKYTTSRVITMEFIDGVRINDLAKLDEIGADKKLVAQNGFTAILKQIYVDGFFHGDPHPANIFAFADGSVCFLDFGMFGEFSEEQRKRMLYIFVCMMRGDVRNYIKHLLAFTETTENADVEGFQKATRELFLECYGTSLSEYSFSLAFFRSIQIAAKYKVLVPSSLVMFAKVLVTAEVIARELDPDFNILVAARPFMEELYGKTLVPMELASVIERSGSLYIRFLRRLLNLWAESMDQLEKGTFALMIDEEKRVHDLLPESQLYRRLLQPSPKKLPEKKPANRGKVLAAVALVVSATAMMFLRGLPEFFGFPLPSLFLFLLAFVVALDLKKKAG